MDLKNLNRTNDIKAVLKTKEGQRVLRRIFKDAYVFTPTLGINQEDSHIKSAICSNIYPFFTECVKINRVAVLNLVINGENDE